MRYLVKTVLFVLLICGAGAAEPNLSVEDMPVPEYREWLGEKETLWNQELENLRAFAPEQVKELERTRKQIQAKAGQLDEQAGSAQADELKAETQKLVYALENSLESLYGELDRQSGPVLVLDL